jgi:hypothetical protein
VGDYSWAERDDWLHAWDDLVAVVGHDFGAEMVRVAADPIEASAVRRYLEPLEFDCPLHFDVESARAHGYGNILAPYSALSPLWTDASRNAQPPFPGPTFSWPAPDTDSVFQTDTEHVFLRPLVVGDRLAATGRKLLGCVPKETHVGRGAFVTWETRVLAEDGELVALMRLTAFFYVSRARISTQGA